MNDFLHKLYNIPKIYGIIVVLIYSSLIGEYISIVLYKVQILNIFNNNFFSAVSRISIGTSIILAILIWPLLALLFHLTALLFNGKCELKKLLFTISYPFIIPIITIIISIILLYFINIDTINDIELIDENSQFKILKTLNDFAFYFYYIVVACIIRYLYNIKWLYAALSVIIPVVSIWGITELFKLL